MSIRNRLLFLLLITIFAIWIVSTGLIYLATQHEVEELFDANLAQNAKVLLGLLHHELADDDDDDEVEIEDYHPLHKYEKKIAFLIRTTSGYVVAHSSGAPIFPLPAQQRANYHNYYINGYSWRVFTLKEDNIIVQTGEREDIRNELIMKIISSILILLSITLLLLAFLIWISVSRGLKPLRQLAVEITNRTPDQLQPIDIQSIPIEVEIPVNALNSLFKRLNQAFENERRFTSDAAHELRTPLAGLKTQTQVAQRAVDPKQHQQALQNVLTGLDRMSHLVVQLLLLARMDANHAMVMYPIDLQKLINQIISDLMPHALEKNIDLGVESTISNYTIWGNEDGLYLLFRNLVDNAIRYTPNDGQVTIRFTHETEQTITVTVLDTGFGIPSEQMERVFERFYRGQSQQKVTGSGLGLSIAQRVAELHKTTIQLYNIANGNGLCVKIQFITYHHKSIIES